MNVNSGVSCSCSCSEKAAVSIVMGSESDKALMQAARDTLSEFGIGSEWRILSAHRTPDQAISWIREAEARGIKVIIAAAGLAAHLAGVAAANSILPVLGVPCDGGPLNGMDALLSTVQMPKGTPVGTLAIGKAGAVNAALLSLRILALSDSSLRQKLIAHKARLAEEVLNADKNLLP
ncbi:MAG: 5-(carboxyamino)imidazole ribonucleotide mutase [Deltaproteobacteria bacterium]|nr:5-(carboxyamino)imidazole ribonucleotide mutase [Deltaproteobacteria bacterium]